MLVQQILALLPDTTEAEAEAALQRHYNSFERALDSILMQQDDPVRLSCAVVAALTYGCRNQTVRRSLPRGCGWRGRQARALNLPLHAGGRRYWSGAATLDPQGLYQVPHAMWRRAGSCWSYLGSIAQIRPLLCN